MIKNIQSAELIGSTILFVFVYFLSVPIIGYMQAWVADKLGDSTAKDHGFLTINPLAHLDILGFLIVTWCYVGWGRYIPIEPSRIYGRWRVVRMIIVYSVTTVVSLTMAFTALVIAVAKFGAIPIENLIARFFKYDILPFRSATQELANHSSLSIIFALFLLAVVFFNSFIAAISFILNGFRLILAIAFERSYKYIEYSEFLTLLAPILVIFFFGNYVRYYLLHLIIISAPKIALFFGVST